MRRRRKAEPVALASLVSKALNHRVAGGTPLDPRILIAWYRAMPPRVARNAVPYRLRERKLSVYVRSATWSQELTMLQQELRQALRRQGLEIDHVVTRVGKVPSLPPSAPNTRPAKLGPRVHALPPELGRALATVGDDDLRALIAAAAAFTEP